MSSSSNPASLPRREYGATGEKLSILGFGGIVVMNAEQDHANRVVAEAVERGVNYFDVAPSYGDAEIRLGPALEPYRKSVFLACKTTHRTREGAEEEFERSLERLRTDHFDLYQLHGITSVEKDVDPAFQKGGVMELLLQAKKEGRVRYLGFTAHTTAAALAAMERYDFDSVLYPVNLACWLKGGFGPAIMERAREKGVARLALKALAREKWPEGDPDRDTYRKCWYKPFTNPREAELGLKFTLSLPVTAAVSPGEESLFRLALHVATNWAPLTPEEQQECRELAATLNPIFSEK